MDKVKIFIAGLIPDSIAQYTDKYESITDEYKQLFRYYIATEKELAAVVSELVDTKLKLDAARIETAELEAKLFGNPFDTAYEVRNDS